MASRTPKRRKLLNNADIFLLPFELEEFLLLTLRMHVPAGIHETNTSRMTKVNFAVDNLDKFEVIRSA